MKVTRYPQSCLILEDNGRCIAIDPGEGFLQTHQESELDNVEAILFTHKHSDHLEPAIIDYVSTRNVELYANHETADEIGGLEVRIVEDGETFSVAGFEVMAHELPPISMPSPG